MTISTWVLKYLICESWLKQYIYVYISAQYVRYEFQCTPRHVASSQTSASVQSCQCVANWHPQDDCEITLRCQKELHIQGYLGVPPSKNPGDSDLASVEAMQWDLLYRPSIGNISYSTAKICRSTVMHLPHSCCDCQWYILQ
jgi:hypothetical protein